MSNTFLRIRFLQCKAKRKTSRQKFRYHLKVFNNIINLIINLTIDELIHKLKAFTYLLIILFYLNLLERSWSFFKEDLDCFKYLLFYLNVLSLWLSSKNAVFLFLHEKVSYFLATRPLIEIKKLFACIFLLVCWIWCLTQLPYLWTLFRIVLWPRIVITSISFSLLGKWLIISLSNLLLKLIHFLITNIFRSCWSLQITFLYSAFVGLLI